MAHAPALVLLIDPEPDLRELEFQVLRDAGYRIEQLTEDTDPVATAEAFMPGVIVVGMPNNTADSWRTVDLLRSNPQTCSIPVVVISTSQRTAAAAAASTNVSETVVAPFDIRSLETAVAAALGKPPAAAALPPATSPTPAYQTIAADMLHRESRTIILRGLRQLLPTEPYRSQFRGLSPELVDNLGLLLGAIVEGLRKDLDPEQVFTTEPVQKTIREHIRLRKRQGIGLDTVVRETQVLEDQVDQALEGFVSASFSAADALVVIHKVRGYLQALVLSEVTDYGSA